MSNTQPMQKTRSICIQDTRSYQGTREKYLRHIGNILKSTQTMLQSIEFCKDWVEHFYCQMSGSRPNQPNTMNLQIMDLRTGPKCEIFPSALIRGACSTFSFFSAFFPGFSKKRIPFSQRASYIIYPIFLDPGPPFVDHAGHLSSACPISCIPKPSISCSNQSSTVQRSFPHLCDQNVICGHLMRR